MTAIYETAQTVLEYSEFILSAKRINEWGIKSQDKKFLEETFIPGIPNIPKDYPYLPFQRYVDSILIPMGMSFSEFEKHGHLNPKIIQYLLRDARAIHEFGWMNPCEKWTEYDLLVAEPSEYYVEYIRKEMLFNLNRLSKSRKEILECASSDGRWIWKAADELQDRILLLSTAESPQSLFYYTQMQNLMDIFGLRGFSWHKDGSEMLYDTFRFCRTGASVHAVVPDYLRSQGLAERFPFKVFEYLCSDRFLPFASLGVNPQHSSKMEFHNPTKLQRALKFTWNKPEVQKRNWTYETFCNELHDFYSTISDTPLSSSTRSDEICKTVSRKYKQAGLDLGPWVLVAPKELIYEITDTSRSLFRCARTAHSFEWQRTPGIKEQHRLSLLMQEPDNPILIQKTKTHPYPYKI